ncbi:MAG: ribosome biogenesis GTP-binding protein YihA/YsxC [Candidatus Margulisiibacteriota bacterium]
MDITSAEFVKGLVGPDAALADGTPQVVLIGRSNVGKSSVINSLTNQRSLARTSSTPGRTQEINLFLINRSLYLLDLPGYGFAQAPWSVRAQLRELIDWYLFGSAYEQKKVVLIIDAKVGVTESDLLMLRALTEHKKNVIIVANKVDKIKRSALAGQLQKIRDLVSPHPVIPYSSEEKVGISDLINEILG